VRQVGLVRMRHLLDAHPDQELCFRVLKGCLF
jgi:hypothetical protein